MKNLYKIGDQKIFEKTVGAQDIAEFESGTVHNVYATFALGRDAEWSSRLFVLDMKDADEEGIGWGFAAFGQVICGMDVVRRIQMAPTSAQTLTPAIAIHRIRWDR